MKIKKKDKASQMKKTRTTGMKTLLDEMHIPKQQYEGDKDETFFVNTALHIPLGLGFAHYYRLLEYTPVNVFDRVIEILMQRLHVAIDTDSFIDPQSCHKARSFLFRYHSSCQPFRDYDFSFAMPVLKDEPQLPQIQPYAQRDNKEMISLFSVLFLYCFCTYLALF